MDLSATAQEFSKELKKIETRIVNTDDVDIRYKLFSYAMNRCTHLESNFVKTGISLLKIMESNQLITGESLYHSLYSELPSNIDGKGEISDMISNAARELSYIKNAREIYHEDPYKDSIKIASKQDIQNGFTALIHACYKVASRSQIK